MILRVLRVLKREFHASRLNAQRWRRFKDEFHTFRKLSEAAGRSLSVLWEDRYPQLEDRTSTTEFDAHYVYHTAWASRVLARTRPSVHVDISSCVYFSAMTSAFIPVRFYDYRPAALSLSNLTSEAADLTALHFDNETISSLSCMHTIEHVGLGRYGDTLDPQGDLAAARQLQRVLAPRGLLLIVVPVGRPRICFNAHRIYSYDQVVAMFDGLAVEEFSLLPDDFSRGLVTGASPGMVYQQRYGCGCFAFRKAR
ncbi:MAG: hypothetical protein DMG12_02640 [Acidobacteria bacterium]|nr:MAG: hypothetical protein DMG12_02640 [Acidobacteriota bacterium]